MGGIREARGSFLRRTLRGTTERPGASTLDARATSCTRYARSGAGYLRDIRRVTATTTTVPVLNIRASYPTGESREPGGQHSTDRQLSPGVGRRSSGGDPRVRPAAVLRRVSICLASRSIVEDDE